MTEQRFESPFGEFRLSRYPATRDRSLRAWDAADEYLLSHVDDAADGQILIVNDSFGALTVPLADRRPTTWSDSFLSIEAIRRNLASAGIDPGQIHCLPSTENPVKLVSQVLIKVPKTLALLEHQLITLKPLMTADTQVLVAGMTRNMPSSLWHLLEQIVGGTETGLAKKKAKLISVKPDARPPPENPYPVTWPLENTDFTVSNHANVFSRESLDIGARLLLQHLPSTTGETDIIDLGCGNGVLGLVAANLNPEARLTLVDESWMAIASARENLAQVPAVSATFHVGDGLMGIPSRSADLILCNPPFHQQHATTGNIAIAMFQEAARALRPDGELRIVGNRHLGYHRVLPRWFGQVEVVASDRKFVVLSARQPTQ